MSSDVQCLGSQTWSEGCFRCSPGGWLGLSVKGAQVGRDESWG